MTFLPECGGCISPDRSFFKFSSGFIMISCMSDLLEKAEPASVVRHRLVTLFKNREFYVTAIPNVFLQDKH